jgi:hypothetical protein
LIAKLYDLEQDQSLNVRGALHDTGKYSLAAKAAILKVSHQTWTQLTPEQSLGFLLSIDWVLQLLTRFRCPGFCATRETAGIVKCPSVYV